MSDAVEAAVAAAAESLRTPEDTSNSDYMGHDVSTESENVDTSTETEAPAVEAEAPAEDAAPAEETPEKTSAVSEPKAEETPPTEEEELKALEAELVSKEPKIQKGAIPTSRHQAVLTRERRKHEAALKELSDKVAAFEAPDVKEKIMAADLAEHRPEIFLHKVLMNDPRYQAEIQKLVDAKLAESGKTAAAPSEPDQSAGEKPEPDIVLSDGSMVYSKDQNEKLIAWHIASATGNYKKEITDLRSAVDPLVNRQRNEAEYQQAYSRMSEVLNKARTNWPGFKDHEPKIREWMGKPENQRASLEDAYRAVVVPSFTTDREQLKASIRAELIKEMNSKRNTQGAKPAGSPPATSGVPDGVDPIEAAIRASMRSIK